MEKICKKSPDLLRVIFFVNPGKCCKIHCIQAHWSTALPIKSLQSQCSCMPFLTTYKASAKAPFSASVVPPPIGSIMHGLSDPHRFTLQVVTGPGLGHKMSTCCQPLCHTGGGLPPILSTSFRAINIPHQQSPLLNFTQCAILAHTCVFAIYFNYLWHMPCRREAYVLYTAPS